MPCRRRRLETICLTTGTLLANPDPYTGYTRTVVSFTDYPASVAATDETFKKAPQAKAKGHEQAAFPL